MSSREGGGAFCLYIEDVGDLLASEARLVSDWGEPLEYESFSNLLAEVREYEELDEFVYDVFGREEEGEIDSLDVAVGDEDSYELEEIADFIDVLKDDYQRKLVRNRNLYASTLKLSHDKEELEQRKREIKEKAEEYRESMIELKEQVDELEEELEEKEAEESGVAERYRLNSEEIETLPEDIGGLDRQYADVLEEIKLRREQPHLVENGHLEPSAGMLFYGPPGNGKTMVAKALANESDMNAYLIKGPEIISKWVGSSEKYIREIVREAKEDAPSMIIFEEFDSIAPKRGGSGSSHNVMERVVNQILTEMDGMEPQDELYWLATTNRKELIDDALLREGRFGLQVEFARPDEESTFQIARKYFPEETAAKVTEWVRQQDGFEDEHVHSGSRIVGVKREVIKQYYRETTEEDRPEGMLEDGSKEDLEHIPDTIVEQAVEKVYEEAREEKDVPDDRMVQ
jgi:transitional endoplasmic reticulum ATPase